MSRGISLHIGLNYVDPSAYGGWDGALSGCINDANDMLSLANSRGFETSKLIDGQATSANVVAKISQAADQLSAGDIFLITYSGHGGQVPDTHGEEADGMDETWVLYDRELIDDELYRMWSLFRKGVRIFVTSDSCHSGTVVKAMIQRQMMHQREMWKRGKIFDNLSNIDISEIKQVVQEKNKSRSNLQQLGSDQKPLGKPRFIPIQYSLPSFLRRKEEYGYIKNIASSRNNNPIEASLIFISGCQDNQYSYDGDENGQFTGQLLKIWKNGTFNGGHSNFFSAILATMPDYQTPNYMKLGEELPLFEAQIPYTIPFAISTGAGNGVVDNSGTGSGVGNVPAHVTPEPSVNGPSTYNRESEPPTFTVFKGINPYYYFEITSDYKLFDSQLNGYQRNTTNFYATWNDPYVSNRLTSGEFKLPLSAWNLMKNSAKLYFRVGTTSSSSDYEWENFMISTYDKEGANAPVMQITYQTTPIEGGVSSGGANQSISASVGRNGVNNREDVKTVQSLINKVQESDGGPYPKLVVDGLIGTKTINAIMRFQEANYQQATGLILPGSAIFMLLVNNRNLVNV